MLRCVRKVAGEHPTVSMSIWSNAQTNLSPKVCTQALHGTAARYGVPTCASDCMVVSCQISSGEGVCLKVCTNMKRLCSLFPVLPRETFHVGPLITPVRLSRATQVATARRRRGRGPWMRMWCSSKVFFRTSEFREKIESNESDKAAERKS